MKNRHFVSLRVIFIVNIFHLIFARRALRPESIHLTQANLTAGKESLQERFAQDLSGAWTYNESFDISKYEDFDHSLLIELTKLNADSVLSPSIKGSQSQTLDVNTRLYSDELSPQVPVFDHNMVTNVSAQLGGTTFLHCRVKNLGERTVSWVRRRDWHILTSGLLTYTNDERFQVVHSEKTENWDLQIKFVQKRDSGKYECQVGTGRGTISHYFNLHVVVPSAFILGSGEYHIGEGSSISLVCIIENSPIPPQYVYWYHNERMINYDSGRGVTVNTEPGLKTHSRLVVNQVTRADTGNYTCGAPNSEPDTIYVFVSKEGDNTAAIQGLDTSVTSQLIPIRTTLLLTLLHLFNFR
uniref:Ig-like domain-containing protein n=1 Tax=Clastoptera arizonana TaxID=38151 RepID=A0A1B6CMM9_9HEMI